MLPMTTMMVDGWLHGAATIDDDCDGESDDHVGDDDDIDAGDILVFVVVGALFFFVCSCRDSNIKTKPSFTD